MKLTIKTLQQLTFTIEIEPEKTVKELKEKIETDHGKEFPCAAQKLIYSGKILLDDSKLSEYEIDEKKFIVLMITRPPPAPKPPAPEKPPAAKAESAASSKDDKPRSTATQSSTSTVSSASTTSTTAPTHTSTTQPPARAAGRGVPELETFMVGEQNIAPRLAALMAQPHFRHIQEMIQQHPHLLSSTIEALANTDPEMYRFISDNPDVFVSALNQPPLSGSRTQSSRGSSGGQQPTRADERTAAEAQNPAGVQPSIDAEQMIDNITDHDKQAIARLKELGFSELQVVQAYVACDKDEQLAANLLFQMDP